MEIACKPTREQLLEDYRRAVIRRHMARYEDLRRKRNRRRKLARRLGRLARFIACVALTIINIVRLAA